MAPPIRPLLLGVVALASTINASTWISPEGYHRFSPRTEGFTWGDCHEYGLESRECSTFEVPLDWTNHSAGKARLAVARYKATKQPKLGTLFINPGGPGESGIAVILSPLVETISKASGGQYDILSEYTTLLTGAIALSRGHNQARILVESGSEESAFWEGTVLHAGLEARGNFTDKRDLDAFYDEVDEVDVLLEELGKRCVAYSPDTFQYIGTAAAVRDMVAMHDVLEGSSKPIDYWGLSYGTAIGIYFVNMFPDRVGRVVLDGVIDPEYYANRPAHEMWRIKPESTDEAFTGFVTACAAAGPSGCALAIQSSTPETIRQQISDLIDTAYEYRQEVGPNSEYTSAAFRLGLFAGMKTPTTWPSIAEGLAADIEFFRNVSLSSNSTHKGTTRSLISKIDRRQASNNGTINDNPPVSYAFQGVTCGDAIDRGNISTKDTFDFLVQVTRDVSQMFGPIWGDAGMYCHRWPVRAVERYTGPWNKKLSNPILVIGNEADPVTPFISAKKVADALGDSAILIEQDDYGHLSINMHSTCTISALQDYFVNNKLPNQDKFCGTDQQLFPGPGITKGTLSKVGTNSNNLSTDPGSLQDELEAARERSKNLFIAVIALGTATGLLLLGLVFSCLRGRRKSKDAHVTQIPRAAFEKGDEQGHTYDAPCTKGDDKSCWYSRVEM